MCRRVFFLTIVRLFWICDRFLDSQVQYCFVSQALSELEIAQCRTVLLYSRLYSWRYLTGLESGTGDFGAVNKLKYHKLAKMARVEATWFHSIPQKACPPWIIRLKSQIFLEAIAILEAINSISNPLLDPWCQARLMQLIVMMIPIYLSMLKSSAGFLICVPF